MACRPIDPEAQSSAIAERLFPERMVGHPGQKGLVTDADAGQRLFAKQIVKHLIENGAIFPWSVDEIPPIPLSGDSDD